LLYGDGRTRFMPVSAIALEKILAEDGEAAVQWRQALKARMHDLAMFMKLLKQRFSKWYNATRRTKGTLWTERYTSTLLEAEGAVLRQVACMIDLNAVCLGVVAHPEDYLWCGFAAARNGDAEQEALLVKLMPLAGMMEGTHLEGILHGGMQKGKSLAGSSHGGLQKGKSLAGSAHGGLQKGELLAEMAHEGLPRDSLLFWYEAMLYQYGKLTPKPTRRKILAVYLNDKMFKLSGNLELGFIGSKAILQIFDELAACVILGGYIFVEANAKWIAQRLGRKKPGCCYHLGDGQWTLNRRLGRK
jgi:hypothetical protein